MVENDARNQHIGMKIGKPACKGCHRMRHARAIDHQNHRQAEKTGEIPRRSGTVGGAVKQPHHRLDHQHPPALRLQRGIGQKQIARALPRDRS
jgi:hypothetical protein